MKIEEAMKELSKPFHPSDISYKPQAVAKDGAKAMAITYADPRAYMNRLDAVCGGEWSVTYTPWGDRIVCHLTVAGVTRSSTGEGDSQSERSEIAGTAAEAQAFKRACVMFGLGRYLYDLHLPWVEFDSQRKQFTEQGKAKLEKIVIEHYRRAMGTTDYLKAASEPQHGNIANAEELLAAVDETEERAPEAEANPFHDDSIGVAAQNKAAEERMKAKAQEWRQMDADSDKPCSEAQYNVLVMAVEKLCGKGSHTTAFYRMFKRDIDSENRPGNKAASWLLDRIPERIPQRDANKQIVKANGKTVLVDNPNFDVDAAAAVATLYNAKAKQPA